VQSENGKQLATVSSSPRWKRATRLCHSVSVGRGIHFCLGAPLDRLEARIATQTILRRTTVTWPGPDGVRERADNALFRGWKRFPVVVKLADAA
jgi:cytochrome P450